MEKRYYFDLNMFITQRKIFLILILITSLLGTIYAVWTRDNATLFYTINQFITTPNSSQTLFGVFKQSIITYSTSATLIFIGSANKNLLPIATLSFMYTIFSYSFTFACFIMLYGMKGIIVIILLMGVSSVVIIGTYIELFYQGAKFGVLMQTRYFRTYLNWYLAAIMVIFGISIFEAIFQPLMQILISKII
ncbi:MAG: hypothetical protein BEN19_04720 [Epulopiscium sp. Nuni2H_MBin003]|nr:MAG: hypothetical protein BEN19_04720 [Epulopiscium sp. Nuni2H_MBin003]